MASKRPTTIAEYIQAAPREGQPHLQRLYAILKSVAPEAEEAIKWGTPFFVEPRFVFAFSAHRSHLSFAPMAAVMKAATRATAHAGEPDMPAMRIHSPTPIQPATPDAKGGYRDTLVVTLRGGGFQA